MADEILRCLVREGAARVVIATTTELSREAARRHQASVAGAVAMSRAGTAALLLATLTKDEERVTVQLHGNGPLGSVTADARASGDVRMYAGQPAAGALGAVRPGARPILADAIGRRGTVGVLRDLGLKERYQGQSTLVTGEIDEDVEHYLRVSEQIDSALGCEAVVGDDGALVACAGLLVQTLPGAGPGELVHEAQHRLRTGALHALLAGGERDPLRLARAALGEDEPLDLLDRRPLRFGCPCSLARVRDMVGMLGTPELDAMIAEGKSAEIFCNFCRERYEVGLEELRAMQAARTPRGEA